MTFLRRLHREESAQITFLGVAGAMCFVALMSMVINTNDVIGERVHMQDVADATALSAAAWTARGLNTISFVNVLNTKLASTAVLLNALADSIPIIKAVGEIQKAIFQGCSGVPFIGAFCAAMAVVVNIQVVALNALQKAVDKVADQLSRCDKGSKLLWKLMNGLETLANGVRTSFGIIGFIEAIDIAKANGADFGIVVNGKLTDIQAAKDKLFLPVKKEKFPAHCPYMKNGGPGFELQNYSCNQGPLNLGRERINKTLLVPFFNLAAHPIFAGMVTKHMTQIGCTPDPGEANNKIPVTLKDLNQCSKYDTSARWSHIWSQTRELTGAEANQYSLQDFIPWRPRNEPGGSSKDAPDLGELQGQLGQLGLPKDEAAGAGTDEKPLGKGLELIPKSNERKLTILYSDKIPCRSPRYPSYTPPSPVSDYDWDAGRPGQVTTFGYQSLYARPIKEWNKFTWVSGTGHTIGGPETAGGYFIRVDKREIDPKEEGADPTYRFVVETVVLVDAGTKEMDQDEFKEYLKTEGQGDVKTDGSKSSESCDKPEPFVLDKGQGAQAQKDFQDRLRFIGVVWDDTDDAPPFWSNFFADPPPTIIAYAQSQVYNYLSEDTFTQDWRVRLEQASLLEDLVKSGKAGKMGGEDGNKGFINALIREVNNH